MAWLQEPPCQASPITLGLRRAMETKQSLPLTPSSVIGLNGDPAVLVIQREGKGRRSREGSVSQASASQDSNHRDRVGLLWLLGPGRGSKGLSPGSEIRLVQGLRVVEMGLIHPGDRARWEMRG